MFDELLLSGVVMSYEALASIVCDIAKSRNCLFVTLSAADMQCLDFLNLGGIPK